MDDVKQGDLALGCVFAQRECQVCAELEELDKALGDARKRNEILCQRHSSHQRDPRRHKSVDSGKKRAVAANPHEKQNAYSIFRHIVVVCASLRRPSAERRRPREPLSDDARAALRRFGHLQRVRVDVDH